jgi:hypothetical protein
MSFEEDLSLTELLKQNKMLIVVVAAAEFRDVIGMRVYIVL